MISAIVFLTAGPVPQAPVAVAVARTLASLVDAALEGLVADVCIAGPPGCDLAEIADHAGCRVVEGDSETEWLAAALARAQRPQCLLLSAGFEPGLGFKDMLRSCRPERPLLFRSEPKGWHRALPMLAPVVSAIAPLALWRAQEVLPFAQRLRGLKGQTAAVRMREF